VIGVLGLAQLAFAKRNYEIALSHYKKALKMNKALPTKARLGMAYCFYELEKYELAKACFKRILDLDPDCIEASIGYGTMCYYEGNKDIYFENLEDCYKRNKNHPLVLLHLAEHMLLSKNLAKLVSVCEKGLESLKGFPIFNDKHDAYRNDQVEYRCRFYHILGQLYHQSG
jgi:RNA polymerase-associated protein CTR9